MPATTIDHVPPRIMFRDRYRPKDLEFPSCRSCNEVTNHCDLVAAMLGRVYPDAKTDKDRDQFKKLLQSINNNIPGLLQEMYFDKPGQKALPRRNVLRTDGPLVSSHLQTFGEKQFYRNNMSADNLLTIARDSKVIFYIHCNKKFFFVVTKKCSFCQVP